MHKNSLIVVVLLLVLSCNTKKTEPSLPQTFIESLKKQEFALLGPYFPTLEFYKSLGETMRQRSDSEIVKFLDQSKERLNNGWKQISERLKSEKINLDEIKIKETLVYNPFGDDKLRAMVTVYDYKDKSSDDMVFVIGEMKDKTYLLEIPNTESFLTMRDTSLKEVGRARLNIEMNKPDFKRSVQDRVEDLIGYAKENRSKEFTENLVYVGEDESRNWKTAMSVEDSSSAERATAFMNSINTNLNNCPKHDYGEIISEKESEGTWIVIPLKCGEKVIHFAFLKINNKLLLGDINIGM